MPLTEEQLKIKRAEWGRIGGKRKNPNKGFGSMDKAKLSEIGRKGGRIGRRTSMSNMQQEDKTK